MGNQFDLRAVSKHNSRLLRARGTRFCQFLLFVLFYDFRRAQNVLLQLHRWNNCGSNVYVEIFIRFHEFYGPE